MKFKLFGLFFLILTILFSLFNTKPTLAASYTLSGKVTDSSGAGISNSTIDVVDTTTNIDVNTTSDSLGNYSLSIDGGTYNVQVTPPSGSNFGPAVTQNRIISSDSVINFILVSSGTVSLSGHLYGPQGDPLKGIILTIGGNGSGATATTDNTGAYSMQVLPGSYTISGNCERGNSNDMPDACQISSSYNALSLTQSTVLDITFPAKKIVVHVQSQGGSSISGATINTNHPTSSVTLSNGLQLSLTNGWNDYSSGTDSSGNETVWLFPQTYNITAAPLSGSGYLTTTASNISITSDATETITLPAASVTLSGHLYGPQGDPLQGIYLEIFGNGTGGNATTNSSGAYSIQVSPGNYKMDLRCDRGNATDMPNACTVYTSPAFSLTQNTVLDINFPAKKVIVHVQDSLGNPVSHVLVSTANYPVSPIILSNGLELDVTNGWNDYYGTNSSGDETLWLLPQTYNIRAVPPSGSGYPTTTVSNISITSDTTETITLPTPVTLSGHVYGPQGDPLQGIVLTIGGNGTGSTVTTDSTGAYSVQLLSGGPYTITGYCDRGNATDMPNACVIYASGSTFSLTQNTVLDINFPAKKVIVHVQDSSGNPVSNVSITTLNGNHPYSNITLANGLQLSVGSGWNDAYHQYYTDSSGNETIWLLPQTYDFMATPESGSIYAVFTLKNISVSSDQTEIISLQFNHNVPVTTASLSPNPDNQGKYSNPVTVTLSATADSGYTIANTYYTIDGGLQQNYSSPFTVSGTGNHKITYWSVDNVGVFESPNTKTFTIVPKFSISGTVYVDVNQNGVQDQGELGYSGATVSLDNGDSVTTDTNGNYAFASEQSGNYILTLTTPSGYSVTTTNPISLPLTADNTVNFGITPLPTPTETPIPTSTPTPIPTATPTPFPTATPTPIPTYTLSGSYYIDANGNGVRDPGELPYPETLTIYLSHNQDHSFTSTTINSNGEFTFSGLTPGMYSVGSYSVESPNSFFPTNDYAESSEDWTTLDVTTNTTHDFALIAISTPTPTPIPTATPTPTPIPTHVLSGTVYVDTNLNGIQDNGEKGYSGATVTLDNNQTVITDNNGNYSISNLQAGVYTESLTMPDGYLATTTNPVALSLTSDTTQNFGIAPLPTPTSTPTPTVTPIPPISSCTYTTSPNIIDQSTAPDHYFYMDYHISANNVHWVKAYSDNPTENVGKLVEGLTFTSDQLSDPICDEPNELTCGYPFVIANGAHMTPVPDLTEQELSYYDWGAGNLHIYVSSNQFADPAGTGDIECTNVNPTPTPTPTPTVTPIPTNTPTPTPIPTHSLIGTVYVDSNQNGIQDNGEVGYTNATVILSTGQTVNTDQNGTYTFNNLQNGAYVETLTVPNGYNITTTNPVDVAISADTTQNFGIAPVPTSTPTPTPTITPTPTVTPIPTATPTPTPTLTPTPTITPTPTNTPTPTPTPVPTYSLSGVVYVDANQNGFQDAGETGYAGATVKLSTGQTITTNTNGNYSFSGLQIGTYIETLTIPSGYLATTANPVTIPLTSNTTQNFGIAVVPTPTPTKTPTPTPTLIPTATPTPTPVPQTKVTFDDISPASPFKSTIYGGINWSSGVWEVDPAIPTDNTNSASFDSSSVISTPFIFINPQVLISMGIYSNSNQTAMITLSCSGNPTVSAQVAPNTHTTLTTNWTVPCTTVTVTSSNSWNTSIDNIVYAASNPGVSPTPTPTPPPGKTLGYSTQGALLDVGDSGYMNGSKFTTGSTGGTATSMSVFVANVDNSTHNKYQMAIYTDVSGHPGTLVAKTAAGTLTAISWNTLAITATLKANTTYWLMYNTNASSTTNYLNNMYFDTASSGTAAWVKQTYGTWPTTFPTATLDTTKFSIYVSYH